METHLIPTGATVKNEDSGYMATGMCLSKIVPVCEHPVSTIPFPGSIPFHGRMSDSFSKKGLEFQEKSPGKTISSGFCKPLDSARILVIPTCQTHEEVS